SLEKDANARPVDASTFEMELMQIAHKAGLVGRAAELAVVMTALFSNEQSASKAPPRKTRRVTLHSAMVSKPSDKDGDYVSAPAQKVLESPVPQPGPKKASPVTTSGK